MAWCSRHGPHCTWIRSQCSPSAALLGSGRGAQWHLCDTSDVGRSGARCAGRGFARLDQLPIGDVQRLRRFADGWATVGVSEMTDPTCLGYRARVVAVKCLCRDTQTLGDLIESRVMFDGDPDLQGRRFIRASAVQSHQLIEHLLFGHDPIVAVRRSCLVERFGQSAGRAARGYDARQGQSSSV